MGRNFPQNTGTNVTHKSSAVREYSSTSIYLYIWLLDVVRASWSSLGLTARLVMELMFPSIRNVCAECKRAAGEHFTQGSKGE